MNYEQLQLKEYLSILGIALGGNNESINNNKFHKTNPIPKKPKMELSLYLTKDYGNESIPSNSEKQTQSNPTCSELVEPILKGRLSDLNILRYEGQKKLRKYVKFT
jgi:hypothetical protein